MILLFWKNLKTGIYETKVHDLLENQPVPPSADLLLWSCQIHINQWMCVRISFACGRRCFVPFISSSKCRSHFWVSFKELQSVSDRVPAHTWTFCSSSSCVVCTYLILCGCHYTPLLVERAHVCVLARTLPWGEGRVVSDASRLIGLARRPSPPHL